MINLDDTKALTRIAEALERIAEAEARGDCYGKAFTGWCGGFDCRPAEQTPGMAAVEVLFALISILWRNLPLDAVGIEKLGALKRRLEPFQQFVRPAGKEAGDEQ
jgi:hypothetical protein